MRKDRYKKLKEQGICTCCCNTPARSGKVYCVDCTIRTRERRIKAAKAHHKRLRLSCIEKLGGRCIHCGYSDHRALQIDHVNGGGTAEYRVLCKNANRFLHKVLEDTEGLYQLLCANCNWIKRCERQEYPVGSKISVGPAA